MQSKPETFGIWLPDNEGPDTTKVLELVDCCNPEIHLRDIRVKYKAKGLGEMLHVIAVQEPSLYSLEDRDWAPFAGFGRVQFQKHDFKNEKALCSEAHTVVLTNVVTQLATGVENVRAASEGAEEPENPDEGSKATSFD